MSAEVLIVDNDLTAAVTYADLVSQHTGLEAIAVQDPDDAKEAIQQLPIKVIVLDQDMGMVKGSDLVHQLVALDPHLRRILITGQRMTRRTMDEVGQALGDFNLYLHKDKILQLPLKVLQQYVAYLHEEPDTSEPEVVIFELRRGVVGARFRVKFVLTAVVEVAQQSVPDTAWLEEERIDAGISEERSVEYKVVQQVKIQEMDASALESTFGLKPPQIPGFQLGLKKAIEKRLTLSKETTTEKVVTRKRTYSLPSEPTDPGVLHVKARSYQRADRHRDLVCSIVRTCTCCGLRDRLIVKIPMRVARIATRHIDYLSDGTSRETPTSDVAL